MSLCVCVCVCVCVRVRLCAFVCPFVCKYYIALVCVHLIIILYELALVENPETGNITQEY